MELTLNGLAECFANVIIDYHRTVLQKHEKDTLKKQRSFITDPSVYIKQRDINQKLEVLCEDVNCLYNNREEHLSLCRVLFKELQGFDAAITHYVRDIVSLKKTHQDQDLALKQARFLKDCDRLKSDLTKIIINLYRLNHDGRSIDFEFKTKENTKINVKQFSLTSTSRSLFSWADLPDFGKSLKTQLLVQLDLSEIPSYKTPTSITKLKMDAIFLDIQSRIEALLESQWSAVNTAESPKARPCANDDIDKISLITFVKRGYSLSMTKQAALTKTETEKKESSGWGITSLMTFGYK